MVKRYKDYVAEQVEICKEFKTELLSPSTNAKVGVAVNIKSGLLPLNGLRHPIENETSGWYLWAGEEFSYAEDFFVPLHIEHLVEWCPQIVKFLALPPGWRFLTDGSYNDVWYDETLLKI